MEIKTELLQKMVAKVIKGAANNKMLPITGLTGLLGIEFKNGELILTTTDGNNVFKVTSLYDLNDDNNFYTIVNADTFAKLVAKTTKENIILENKNNCLEVVGNGTYQLDIAVNEEGQLIKFKDVPTYTNVEEVNLKNLQNAITFAKAAVAKKLDIPMLTGYYLANDVITTDQKMVCKLDTALVATPMLISYSTAELLLLLDGQDTIQLARDNNNFCFTAKGYVLFGQELEGKEIYPVKPIEDLLALQYESSVKVNKQELLNILDRMDLFISDYDKGGIYLTFTNDTMQVTSQKSNATEELALEESINVTNNQYLVNIDMLKAQLQVLTTDLVEIHFGTTKSIKFVEGNASLVIALQDK